ncbi:DUF1510 family protein [Bacillus sp. S/N-304-OC-R1]|nr:DUF1510 family protein [Bacillus sp. S/N-304-OC-R1]
MPPSRESRSGSRGKRRKTNLILNLLIGLVILLIIIVSSVIFFGGSNNENTAGKANDKKDNQIQENESSSDDQSEIDNNNTDSDAQETAQTNIESEDQDSSDDTTNNSPEKQDPAPANEEDAVVTDGGEGDNVKKTIENSSWKPIGTSQAGEHTSVYDADSVDWAEMLQAISYATGISQDNMTVWFLGNNGHNKSVGTISSKDQQEKYRVYIEWVDGQGWKPTKVEEVDKVN